MQISITNGILTQVQETLSPASGYELPATVTVTGATSVYSEGTLILTNPMSTISITASAEEPTVTVPAFFADVSLTEEEGYIVLNINGVGFDIETVNNLISFSIVNNQAFPTTTTTTYQAEQGMTWDDWVNSNYNTDGFIVRDGTVISSGGINSVYNENTYITVQSTDTIIANATYQILAGGGSN